MSRRLLAADAATVALGALGSAGTETVEGTPAAAAVELAELAGIQVGVWEMTPGAAHDVEADEVFVVLAGRGLVEFQDGERIDLRPGAVVRLFAGDHTRWSVSEPIRKVYLTPSA